MPDQASSTVRVPSGLDGPPTAEATLGPMQVLNEGSPPKERLTNPAVVALMGTTLGIVGTIATTIVVAH